MSNDIPDWQAWRILARHRMGIGDGIENLIRFANLMGVGGREVLAQAWNAELSLCFEEPSCN